MVKFYALKKGLPSLCIITSRRKKLGVSQGGKLKLEYFNLETSERLERELAEGDTVHLKPCIPHKLTALEDSDVFEVSTQHFNEDSYRVEKGSSQT